ncbi:hypothetical protein HDU87_005536 [Geranomyces variabilis]|uniref:Uncharacterized protein n=1 Tax=Geranomyces variabilis TaxID=109894 RepID=A0AAD5TJ42_9FUNG|nr:hypothetical protein HDU87_005536 [Geranomyces variabilis]
MVTQLGARDAYKALKYLIERYSSAENGWVAHELAGEICSAHQEVADSILDLTIARMNRTSTAAGELMLNEALKALLKCGVTTSGSVATVSRIVESSRVGNRTVESHSRDHAVLLLGHMSRFASNAGNQTLANTIHDQLHARLAADIDPNVYASALGPSSTPDLHTEAFAASAQAAKHANILLALGNTQRPAAVNTLQNILLPNATTPAYPLLIYQSAAHALGTLEGAAVENALLSAIVHHHPTVSQAARTAYRLRKRSASIEEVISGIDALQAMGTNGAAETVAGNVLRAREFLSFHRRDLLSGSLHFGIAAPSFQWDKKFGPDLVGVHIQAHAINSVSLDLSVISSQLNIDIDNQASASLYIDIGGYQELPIFSASLQFIANAGYDMDMLKGFKFSDLANIKDEFEGVLTDVSDDIKIAIQDAQTAWADVVFGIQTVEEVAGDLATIDWSTFFDNIVSDDDDISAVVDMFSDAIESLQQCGRDVQSLVISTFNEVVANVTTGLGDILGGIENIAICPQQAVAGLIAGVEDIEAAFFAAEYAFISLRQILSPDSLISAFPQLDEDFLDFMSNAQNSTESRYFSEVIEMYRNVTSVVSGAEADALAYLSTFKLHYALVRGAYDKMKAAFDAVFGPKFHVKFPAKIAASADGSPLQSGVQWTDSHGFSYQGIRVVSTPYTPVVCPMAGVFSAVDENTFVISVTENSLRGYNLFLTGIAPNATLRDGTAVRKGQIVGEATSATTIGVSLVKKSNAAEFLDPGKYLSRRIPSLVSPFSPSANSYSFTAVGYSIVPVTSILDLAGFKTGSSSTTSSSSSATAHSRRDFVATNVCDVDEFPNPPSPMCGGGNLPEQRKSILLFKTSEFFLVAGFIPVTFSLEFDAIMGIAAGLQLCLLDLAVNPTITPEFAIVMSGSLALGIGGLLSAGLTAAGTVADTHVPIAGQFPLATIPAGVCLDIEMTIVPLTLTLSINVEVLIISYSAALVTFTSDAATLQIMNTCPAPGLVGGTGFLLDSTPPVFAATDAFQVIGQTVAAPLIFGRFSVSDPESGVRSVAVSVGRSPGDSSIVGTRTVPLDQGESLTMVGPTDMSFDEQTLYVSFYATNQQNLTTTASVAILYDLSPPSITLWDDYSDLSLHQHPVAGDEPRSALRLSLEAYTLDLIAQSNGTSFSAFSDHLCFFFTIADQTPLASVKYAIGTSLVTPNDTVAWTTVTISRLPVVAVCESNLELAHGVTYYVTVTAIDALNYTTTASTNGTNIDLTPPVSGQIFFGTAPGQITNGTQIRNVAFISFSGFQDDDSGSAWWRAAIGPSSAEPQTIAANPANWSPFSAWTTPTIIYNPPTIISAPIESLALPEGNHTVCIQVQNFVGLATIECQAGYIVDVTPPSGHGTIKALGPEVTISFEYTDNLSGVQKVWVAIGDGDEPVYSDWQTFDLSQSGDLNNATFIVSDEINGKLVYGQLLLIDYAGNVFRTATNDFIQLDLVPPIPGIVYNGEFWSDVSYINGTELCVSFTEWTDSVTGIGSYDVSFGSLPNASDIISWETLSKAMSYCTANFSELVDQAVIFANVRGWNLEHSLSATASSAGIVVDMSPPSSFNVTIDTSSGTNITRETASITMSWTPAMDYESTVVEYLVAVGQMIGGLGGIADDTALAGYANLNPANPLLTSATMYGIPLSDGDVIYASVIAVNGAGDTTVESSATVLVATGRPQLLQSSLLNNASAGSLTYVLNATSINLSWSWRSTTPLAYDCGVTSKSDGIAPPSVDTVANATGCFVLASPALLDGETYTVVLAATTSAGVTTEEQKDFTVATLGPTFLSGGTGSDVLNTPNITSTTWTQSARGWWKFDQGSAVLTGYSFGFGTAAGLTDLTSGWMSTSQPFAAFAPPSPLLVGEQYFLSVSAVNEAGLMSIPTVFTVGTSVVAGAVAGVVVDGALGLETSYQEISGMLAASFSGFKGSTGILGESYEWALGTQPHGSDMVDFSTTGLIMSSVPGAGNIIYPIALAGETYYVTVRGLFGGNPLQTVESSSRGVRIVDRPPSTEFTATGVKYVSSEDTAMVNCVGADEAGTLNSISILVGSPAWNSTGQDVVEIFNGTSSRSLSHVIGPDGTAGVALFSQCQTTNILAGVNSSTVGPVLVFDSSPPSPPPGLLCTPSIVSPTGFFSCAWLDSTDPESGITAYSASAGITAGGSEIQSFPNVIGRRVSVNMQTFPGGLATPPPAIYFSVKATNAVGMNSTLASTSIRVDSTPPTVDSTKIRVVNAHAVLRGGEIVQTWEPADCQSSTTSMVVDWTKVFQDLDSNIITYKASVESRLILADGSQQSRIVHPMSSAGDASQNLTVDTLSFTQVAFLNGILIATIEATNEAGLSATAQANVSVVNNGPQPLLVQQSLSTSSNASSFSIGTNLLQASWIWSSPCPIKLYQLKVVEVDTATVIYGPTLTNLTSASLTNLPLKANRTYVTTVDAWNSLGMISVSTGKSAGTSIIWAPARPGIVWQGPVTGTDQNTFINTTFLSASWQSFASQTCLVQGYEWAVGTDTSSLQGQSDVLPFTSVGQALNASYNLPSPVALFTAYFVSVRAIDCTGTELIAFSGGFHMGQEVPPQLPVVSLGTFGTNTSAQQSTSNVTVSWAGAASIWSAVKIYVALGTTADPPDMPSIRPFTQVNSTANSFTFTGLKLGQYEAPTASSVNSSSTSTLSRRDTNSTVRTPYSLTVVVQDQSGQNTTKSAEFVVDTTPPVPGIVTLLNQATWNRSALGPATDMNKTRNAPTIVWQPFASNMTFFLSGAHDDESGVVAMEYRIETSNVSSSLATQVLLDWTPFQIATSVTVYLQLAVNTPYIVRLRVTNGAGLQSETLSVPLAVDLSPPIIGDINLGTDMSAGLQYLSSRTILPWTFGLAATLNQTTCPSYNDSFVPPNAPSGRWTSAGCSLAASGAGLVLKPNCVWYSATYGSGSAFIFRMQASNATGAISSIIVTDSSLPMLAEPSPTASNDFAIFNSTFPYSAIGIVVTAGPISPTVAVTRINNGEKVWRQKLLPIQADPTQQFLTYSVSVLRTGLLITVSDDLGVLQSSMSMSPLSGALVFNRLPRLAARFRLWNAPSMASMIVTNVQYPSATSMQCNFGSVTSDLESSLIRYQIGLGTQKGTTDILNLTDLTATTIDPNTGCLGDHCVFSQQIDPSSGVLAKQLLVNMSQTAAGPLIPALYTPNWCSLTVLQGGCASLASCKAIPSVITGLNFTCACPQGYQGNGVGPFGCSDIDEVSFANATGVSLCGQNAVARNIPGGFACNCLPGYQGSPYDMVTGCVNINECLVTPTLCGAGGVCQDLPGTWQCVCRAGFASADSKNQSCAAVNSCPGNCSSLATCFNTAAGQYLCQCPPGSRGTGMGSKGCIPAGSTCALSAPVAWNSSFAASLTSPTDLVPGQTAKLLYWSPTLLAKWFSVTSNGAGVIVNVTSNAIIGRSLSLYITGDCLAYDVVPVSCNTKTGVCTGEYLAPVGGKFYFAVSSVSAANFTCTSGWTASDCSVPLFNMLPRVTNVNMPCEGPFAYNGTVYSNATFNPCAPTLMPGAVAPANASYTFQGCYGSFFSWSSDQPEPPRLSLDMVSSSVSWNGTVQDCANTCQRQGTPLFSYHMAPSTFSSWFWPTLNSKTTSCLCMPTLPESSTLLSMTSCHTTARTWASQQGGIPVYAVTPPAAWCPVAETLNSQTNLSLTFNNPRFCAPRTTVGGATCVFPFLYRGVQYTDCISTDAMAPWCYIDPVMQKWDYCQGVDYCSNPVSQCPASSNSTCTSGLTKAQCMCNAGYAFNASLGAGCYDIDECAQGTAVCDQRGYCVNTLGSYSCACNATLGLFLDPVDQKTCYWLPDQSPLVANRTVVPTYPNSTKVSIPYFPVFKMINGANLSSTVWSDSFIIDEDPPVLNSVVLYARGLQVSVLSPGDVTATWDFSSPTSGIAYYEYSIGTSATSADIIATQVTLNKTVTFTVTAAQYAVYYLTVTAFNGALLNATTVLPIPIETVGPSTTGVAVSLFSFGHAVSWTPFNDLVGVTRVYAAIGSRAGQSDIMSWSQVGGVSLSNATFIADPTCVTCGSISTYLPTTFSTIAVPVYFSIQAANQAGLLSSPVSAPAALLLGTDASTLSASGNLTVGNFINSQAQMTVSATLVSGAHRLTVIPINSAQYQMSQSTATPLTVPANLTIYRTGSTSIKYLQIHVLIASVGNNASLDSTMMGANVSAACQIAGFAVPGAAQPVVYYSGTVYNQSTWMAQKTAIDPITGSIKWTPTLPGYYAVFLNTTVPSYLDYNKDALADIMLTSGKGAFYSALSPSWTTLGLVFNQTGVPRLSAISDFDGDGILDVAVANTSGTYLSTMTASASVRKTVLLPAPSLPAGSQRFVVAPSLLGLSDIDGDLVPDLIWSATTDRAGPVLLVGPSTRGNYTNPGVAMPVSLPYADQVVGLGSWGTRTGVLCSTRNGPYIYLYTMDLPP